MDLLKQDGARRRISVAAVVLTSVVLGASAPAAAEPLPGNGIDVTGYDLTLDYAPETRALRGVAVVSSRATSTLASFTLSLKELNVSSITVDGRAVKSFAHSVQGELRVEPAAPVGQGAKFQVRID